MLRPDRPGAVVLIYHRVGGGSGVEMDLAPDAFDAQMAWLAEHRRVTTLDDALAWLADPVGEPPVVVTFDDGTADLVDHALPILDRHRVPALLYLATAGMEDGMVFPHDGTPLSWAGVREMVDSGWVQVGSHTHTHALLDRSDNATAELDRSIELIGEHVGVATPHFAYPKALAPSEVAAKLVRDRFQSAALAGTRPNLPGRTDPFRLARTPIQASDTMRWFTAKVDGGMRLEDDLRRILNRARYVGATQ